MRYKLRINKYLKEVRAQGRKNVNNSYSLTKQLVDLYCANDWNNINLIACGSSYNGALCVKHHLQEILKIRCNVFSPVTFYEYEMNLSKNDFCIFISFSGSSTNIIRSVKKAEEIGIKTIGLVGNLDCDMKKYCSFIMDYGLNGEDDPYTTKGLTLQNLFLILFGLESAKRLELLGNNDYKNRKCMIMDSLELHDKIMRKSKIFTDKHLKELLTITETIFCGNGPAYGMACEAALKFSELLKVPSSAYESEEALHGPLYRLNQNTIVFLIDTGDDTQDRSEEIYKTLRKINDRVFLITNKVYDDRNVFSFSEKIEEFLLPISCLVFFQKMVYELTLKRNSFEKNYLMKNFDKMIVTKTKAPSKTG